jgi:hypothetical protein
MFSENVLKKNKKINAIPLSPIIIRVLKKVCAPQNAIFKL